VSYLAAILVNAKTIAPVVAAAPRHARRHRGPVAGWCAITDNTRHTVDLGVATTITT
jgi:hypothetical protein